jgi:UDP-N-acetylglucosamine:LPS N-acetylglucosamine transferase
VSNARQLRALLVYSRVGGGHLSAARALSDELQATRHVSTRLVDAYVECGGFPLPLFPAAYARLARRHPRLWSLLYHGSDSRFAPQQTLRPFLRRGFARLLADERPDVVISVLPMINGLLGEAGFRVGARSEVVLTDWSSVHRSWVARGVQHYTVPTESARLDLIRYGAPADGVDVVGIPVRRAFGEPMDRQRVRQHRLAELGLDPTRFTILAMVGAEGSPRAFNNVRQVAQLQRDAQLVVICGRNEELRERVAAMQARLPIRAVGFVEHVSDLMKTADVLLTKAGGLTLAEAFCSGVPVVVHDILPGQESGNVRHARQQGAVEVACTSGQLVRLVNELMDQPERRVELAARGARLARPHAARDIAANVLRRLETG